MPIVTPGANTLATSLAALATEINSDPLALGYAALLSRTDKYQAIADRINTNPEPVTAAVQESIWKRNVPAAELMGAMLGTDIGALSQAARDTLGILFGLANVNTGDAGVRALFAAIFPAGSTSVTQLTARASRTASRAEALWGEGVVINQTQVATALGAG